MVGKTCKNKVMLFFLNGEVLTFARINVFNFIRTCLHTCISSSHHMVVLTPDNGCTMECFKVDACVHGYHHYKNAWSAVKGEVLYTVCPRAQRYNNQSLFSVLEETRENVLHYHWIKTIRRKI